MTLSTILDFFIIGILIVICYYIGKIWRIALGNSNSIAHLKNQIPNRYKNSNGEIGTIYHKED